jgi:pyrroloquinoline-quinone synthase
MRPVAAPLPIQPRLALEELEAAATLEEALALVAARYDFSRHAYFLWLEGASRDDFRRTQIPFRFAVEDFSQSLAAVLAHVTHPDARGKIAENVAEEHGHGNELLSHKATFLQYLRALGAQPDELALPCPAGVRAFHEALLSFCLENGAEAGAAATGMIEHLYIWISGTIARHLVARSWCAPDSQRHYQVHETLDQTHARDLLDVARPAWSDSVRRAQVALGLLLGAHWFWALYRDVYECR